MLPCLANQLCSVVNDSPIKQDPSLNSEKRGNDISNRSVHMMSFLFISNNI